MMNQRMEYDGMVFVPLIFRLKNWETRWFSVQNFRNVSVPVAAGKTPMVSPPYPPMLVAWPYTTMHVLHLQAGLMPLISTTQ